MSINDLLNDDSLIPIMMIIFVVIMIIAIPAGIAMSKKTNKSIYGDGSHSGPMEQDMARIIARRTNPHPLNQAVMVNYIVFETDYGKRIELAIKNPETFSIMVEGDVGLLRYQGKEFIDFQRTE